MICNMLEMKRAVKIKTSFLIIYVLHKCLHVFSLRQVLHIGKGYCMQARDTACRKGILHAGKGYCMQERDTAFRKGILHAGEGYGKGC